MVLEALTKQSREQQDDKLLLDVIAAIPRSTPQRIEEVINDLKSKDEQAAEQLEIALDHCNELSKNLNGMSPDNLWTEPVRMLWTECINALTAQTARWKCTPVVVVHPFCGKIVVLTSLCGKHQAKSEYARMENFMDDLKNGMENVLNNMPTIRDEQTGASLTRDEVKDILLDLSNGCAGKNVEADGRLSEEDESEHDGNFDELNRHVERVSEDWSTDVIDDNDHSEEKPTNLAPTAPPRAALGKAEPLAVPLTITPPQSMISSSPASELLSPLPGYDIVSSTQQTPPLRVKFVNQSVSRSLFGQNRRVSLAPATLPSPDASPIKPRRSSLGPPLGQTRGASDLSAVYPDGYTVMPVKNRGKKPDARKVQPKKRAVSSPNYPSSKSSRLDQTEAAISQLQLGQANQNQLLLQLSKQMSTMAVNLGLAQEKEFKG